MADQDGAHGSGAWHHWFHTSDPEDAEAIIQDSYQIQHRLVLCGDPAGFAFTHGMTGEGAFTLNRLRHSMSIRYDNGPMDEMYAVNDVHAGRWSIEATGQGELRAGPGDLALSAPHGAARYITEDTELVAVTLAKADVAGYAAAMCGVAGDDLIFTGLGPITPAAARHWRATVAHVRDHVLTTPDLIEHPIMVEHAFQSLTAALLSTFANSALSAATDPDRPGVHRTVSAPRLREVVDYIEDHAGDPVGPDELADLAQAPYPDLEESYRHRHGIRPAEHLWNARLRGVQRDLRDGEPAAGDTVPEIAARWGFADPGTFACAYTLATGEDPHDTLRR